VHILKHKTVEIKTLSLAKKAKLPVFFSVKHNCKVVGMKTSQQLSQQAIKQFKSIYQEQFKKRLSNDEVKEIAICLLRFFGILSNTSQFETGSAKGREISGGSKITRQ
jgi:hypothetical protein